MSELPGWIAQYGQLGVMVWIVFEVRDLKRALHSHVLIYHEDRRATPRDG
jgi:hypothetical protein